MVTGLFLQCGTDSCEQVDIAVLVFREELSSYKENNLGICIYFCHCCEFLLMHAFKKHCCLVAMLLKFSVVELSSLFSVSEENQDSKKKKKKERSGVHVLF